MFYLKDELTEGNKDKLNSCDADGNTYHWILISLCKQQKNFTPPLLSIKCANSYCVQLLCVLFIAYCSLLYMVVNWEKSGGFCAHSSGSFVRLLYRLAGKLTQTSSHLHLWTSRNEVDLSLLCGKSPWFELVMLMLNCFTSISCPPGIGKSVANPIVMASGPCNLLEIHSKDVTMTMMVNSNAADSSLAECDLLLGPSGAAAPSVSSASK